MLKLNLGATAAGVGTSVLVVEEEASQSSTDVPMDDGSSAAGVKSQVAGSWRRTCTSGVHAPRCTFQDGTGVIGDEVAGRSFG